MGLQDKKNPKQNLRGLNVRKITNKAHRLTPSSTVVIFNGGRGGYVTKENQITMSKRKTSTDKNMDDLNKILLKIGSKTFLKSINPNKMTLRVSGELIEIIPCSGAWKNKERSKSGKDIQSLGEHLNSLSNSIESEPEERKPSTFSELMSKGKSFKLQNGRWQSPIFNEKGIMTFGYHKGKHASDLPLDYVEWASENIPYFTMRYKQVVDSDPVALEKIACQKENNIILSTRSSCGHGNVRVVSEGEQVRKVFKSRAVRPKNYTIEPPKTITDPDAEPPPWDT